MSDKSLQPQASVGFIKFSLVASIILEKLAIPGTTGALSFSLVVLALLTFILFIKGQFSLNTNALIALIGFITIGLIDTTLDIYTKTSLFSFILIGVIQAPLLFRLRVDSSGYQPVILFFADLSAVCALIGILQFVAQYAFGSDIAFYLDFHLPDNMSVTGYNNLNPLYYNSPIYKPNGFFFLEPSYLNQFLAIGIVAEITTRFRKLVLALLAISLIITYSGTGLIMLSLLVPYIALQSGNYRILIIILSVSVVLWPLADIFQLGLIFDRVGEFSDDQSSGFARFYGAFLLLEHALSASDGSLYLGRGPGTIFEFESSLSFVIFDPTWAKIIYEYGLAGTFMYTLYFISTIINGRQGLVFAVGFTYLVLGGYLADPLIITLVATLVVWPGRYTGDVALLNRSSAQYPNSLDHSNDSPRG